MLKAIDTPYKGYLFRSRLEARWAVFFDALGVRWEYEREGYHLPSGNYLPDFWLPGQDCWVEIKGEEPTGLESSLAGDLADATGKNAFIFYGPIFLPGWGQPGEHLAPPAQLFEPEFVIDPETGEADGGGWDDGYLWCQCEQCGSLGIRYEARSDRLPCKTAYCCNDARWERCDSGQGVGGSGVRPRLHGALCPEHGENLVPGCLRSYHGDRGHNPASPDLVKAYRAAMSARFEHKALLRR